MGDTLEYRPSSTRAAQVSRAATIATRPVRGTATRFAVNPDGTLFVWFASRVADSASVAVPDHWAIFAMQNGVFVPLNIPPLLQHEVLIRSMSSNRYLIVERR